MADTSMYDQKRYDKRLIERHLHNGLANAHITEEDLKKHLADLPDLADKCEPVSIPQPICHIEETDAENAEN